jgi:hypothetical protein
VTDRPRLVGWSSLCRARRRPLTPLVAVAGTAPPVPTPEGSWLDTHLAVGACLDPRDLDRHRAAPCGVARATIGTPSVVSQSTGLPRPPWLRAPSCLNALRNLAHRSRLGAAASCVSTWCGVPLGQRRVADLPCGSSCVATRDASDRLLPSHASYEHPRLAGFRCVMRFRACAIGEIACLTSERFASVGRTFSVESSRWACCSRRDACGPNLWHPCRLSPVCHPARAECALVRAAKTVLDSPA